MSYSGLNHRLPSYTETAQFTQKFFPAELLYKQKQNEKELSESDLSTNYLKTGDKIPNFSLLNTQGKLVCSEQLLRDKPWLIITFYQGVWCPFSNLNLQYLQQNINKIYSLSANLVAISPQTLGNSLTTAQANKISFEILSDVGSKVAELFKITYVVPEYLNEVYARNGVDFQYFNGRAKIELPIFATYIVDNQGVIQKHFVKVSPTEGLNWQEIIDFLKRKESIDN